MQWSKRASLKSYSAVWRRPYAGPKPVKLGIMSLPMPGKDAVLRGRHGWATLLGKGSTDAYSCSHTKAAR
jgi:hypothetical protein